MGPTLENLRFVEVTNQNSNSGLRTVDWLVHRGPNEYPTSQMGPYCRHFFVIVFTTNF